MSTIEFYGNYPVYSESGVDLTLLRENLKRPFEERLRSNSRMAKFAQALQASGADQAKKSVGEIAMSELDAPGLLRQLCEHRVEFVLIGGLAMIAHGSAYNTKDLDICYSRSPENISALAAALDPLHPYLRGAPPGLPFRFDAATIQAGLNFTLITDLGDIDLLGEVKGVGLYEHALVQSAPHSLYGLTFPILSLDGLIAAKRAAGRAKDRNHLLELEELKRLRENPQG